ncbi:hypothetical protein [Mesorhizobium sp. M0522]|uniref:hypothetical protein n=1 Tax=Mesorhizobium sp. M0522 TaxID=2956958 RepID=UPI003338F53D
MAYLGYTSDLAGNALAGVPAAGTTSFVAAPALSPFATPALSLSVGATLLDLKVSAADLGLRVGEPVEIIVDLIAAQSLQIIGSIAVSSGVAHNESNTVNPAVAGGLAT